MSENVAAGIEFVELPPLTRGTGKAGRGRWQLIAAALEERPGEWARVATAMTETQVGNGRVRLKQHGCEATARKSPAGFDLYARYLAVA